MKIARAPHYSLLFGNLEQPQAGEVISALDKQSVSYQIRGNSIYVEDDIRDEIRLRLASEGLPATSVVGYELLDQLTGFGTTSQMFDAAHSRALEGELARTIGANAFIREARVHIARQDGFVSSRNPSVTASVIVKPSGMGITPSNAKALKFLVSSAVSGLKVENVAIIDANAGSIIEGSRPEAPFELAGARDAEMEAGVERLLEAHVGRGNAMVEVTLEIDTDTESIFERRFDPEGQVAISTDSQEISRNSSGPAGGVVTVASNVPSGDAAGGSAESRSQEDETRERTNFEVSEIQREVEKVPGAIKRLSVAVLVDGINELDGNGAPIWRTRNQEELDVLRDLVQSAVGFREERGDIVTIKSLRFEPHAFEGSSASTSSSLLNYFDLLTLIQFGTLSLIVLFLGYFVVRPVLLQRHADALPSPSGLATGLSSTMVDEGMPQKSTSETIASMPGLNEFSTPMSVIDDFNFDASESDAPLDKLKHVVEVRQPDTVEILRSWIETPDVTEEFA